MFWFTFATVLIQGWEGRQKQDKPEDLPVIAIRSFRVKGEE
jgi:hypothetical protein